MLDTRFFFTTVLAGFAVAAAGCAVGTGEPGALDDVDLTTEAKAGGEREPPAGTNGLLPSCFWAHGAQAALRSLGNAALDQGGGALPVIATSLLPEACRSVLRDTVECALPEGQSILDPVTGESYEGWWGLAPAWQNAALNTDGRRYVTACLVQRLNASGAEVPILLEGPHPAIAQSAALASTYSLEESTVLGDLFSSQMPLTGVLPAFNVYSCWEDLLPLSCGALGLPLLNEERICDDLILCGYVSLGPCSLACLPNGPYNKCKPGLLSPYWTQTVRVRLDPSTCQ